MDDYPYRAFLVLNSWGGPTYQEVEVIGETPKRLRIRAITDTRLAGRQRYLPVDYTTLVPKHSITRERR